MSSRKQRQQKMEEKQKEKQKKRQQQKNPSGGSKYAKKIRGEFSKKASGTPEKTPANTNNRPGFGRDFLGFGW